MLNILWPIFIIISFVYALFTGNIESVNKEIFESTTNAVQLSITLLGTMCMWCGIMQIAQNTQIISLIKKLLKPIIDYLFPKLKKNEKAKNEIALNMTANILGLGNAATPMGLKSMETLKYENKEKDKKDEITDSMAMLIVLNTASIQLIPTTVIAIRLSLNSQMSTKIIIPVWISTICAGLAGVLSTKFYIRVIKKI